MQIGTIVHSAGPWTSKTEDGTTSIFDASGQLIATVPDVVDINNVPVILDAPELLKALLGLLNYFGEYQKDYGEKIPEIQAGWAVVNKVTGCDPNFDDGFDGDDDLMDYDTWFDTYKPIQNHFDDNASMDGTMFETYGQELEFVQSQFEGNPGKIWTLIEEDGKTSVASGLRHVNRLGYYITEESYGGDYVEVFITEDAP